MTPPQPGLTLAQMKVQLAAITTLKDPAWSIYEADPRKGAQTLVRARRRQLMQATKALKAHQARLTFEQEAYAQGYRAIAGVDEVGRGPLAGPVVAAAVILPEDCDGFVGMTDSKQLSASRRAHYLGLIQEQALAYGVGVIASETIDRLNIYQATKMAMAQALDRLKVRPDYLLIDAMTLDTPLPQQSLIKGDQRSLSIAAASIVAKEHRDQLMRQWARKYPGFDFDKNVGYGTPRHLQALKIYGYTPIHRQSFDPIKSMTNRYQG